MKISVDDLELFTLTNTQKLVIKYDINADEFDVDMKRRLKYILTHKYEQCMKRLRDEWTPKLKDLGVTSVPLDDDEFADLVFSQPSYQDRKARDQV